MRQSVDSALAVAISATLGAAALIFLVTFIFGETYEPSNQNQTQKQTQTERGICFFIRS
jgi:hypothetical protein